MPDTHLKRKVDPKEFELPETVFVRTVEDRVFQSIVIETLGAIPGISIAGGNLIDSLLGRDATPSIKGITIEQDNKNHSVGIKVEVNVALGIPIPDKAEEIQSKLAEQITHLTGLHVSSVHVVFKNIISTTPSKKGVEQPGYFPYTPVLNTQEIEERYTDKF